ncbi:hypothetical protein ACCO45_003096 [Purpureocillium lilacinum]|uniref:Uncharacterized protein n=1 Tax=Purpureocillium lilacinum TaxID=33203 RepID=A0ACC4DZU2_PURLI
MDLTTFGYLPPCLLSTSYFKVPPVPWVPSGSDIQPQTHLTHQGSSPQARSWRLDYVLSSSHANRVPLRPLRLQRGAPKPIPLVGVLHGPLAQHVHDHICMPHSTRRCDHIRSIRQSCRRDTTTSNVAHAAGPSQRDGGGGTTIAALPATLCPTLSARRARDGFAAGGPAINTWTPRTTGSVRTRAPVAP